MPPKSPKKTSPKKAALSKATTEVNDLNRQARYRQKHREEINKKKREKMREKRAIERSQTLKATAPTNLTAENASSSHGRLSSQPWLQSTEELACAEVLASLRSRASVELTPQAFEGNIRRDVDETIRVAAIYTELDGCRYLSGLRSVVQKWGSIWGGVTYWPDAMEEMFLDACRQGRTQVMELSYQVWDHAGEGRRLLQEIESMDGRLPDEPRAMKMLWIEYSKLHHMLVRGITIIEARMNALDGGIFRLPGVPVDSDEEEGSFGELEGTEENLEISREGDHQPTFFGIGDEL